MHPATVVESTLRVRYAETDAEGVVYYANYLIYMEVARVNYLRALGVDRELWGEQGLGLVIAEANCRYHAPAHFDEELVIRAWLESAKRSSSVMRYEVVHKDSGRLLAEGHTVQVFVDLKTMKPAPIPAEVLDKLQGAVAETQSSKSPR